ncbi:MAG: type II secretion system protein [Planctomycetota bacterium]|nr:type II secretion system protein [Planctomycetota bacterium]
MNRKKSGFTLVELLTVLAIIAMLVGLLLPALSVVRKAAKEVKQQAQITTIELALVAFKNDYGDYPPSDSFSHDVTPPTQKDYCGAQKLAEALLGRDLFGFHPKSTWSATDLTWYPDPAATPPAVFEANLKERKGPYLELATANAFRLGELFDTKPTTPLNLDRFVICDAFGRKTVKVGTKTVKAGTPVLYFRANTSSKSIVPPVMTYIYDIGDNDELIKLGRLGDGKPHSIYNLSTFVPYIMDPKASTAVMPWPYRPDSYILISAGADGFYGTPDDIRNFGY